jgi:hypothetical protein
MGRPFRNSGGVSMFSGSMHWTSYSLSSAMLRRRRLSVLAQLACVMSRDLLTGTGYMT